MARTENPTTVADALENLTAASWHTERALIERRIAMLEDIVRVLPASRISGEASVGSELSRAHLELFRAVVSRPAETT
jgi:hypothetical protein